MEIVQVDFSKATGKMRPMHSVNNGPIHRTHFQMTSSNLKEYTEAGIPYARNHDASFNSVYGGEHTVDVHAIFPNFDADPCDPRSYDFACTDEYLRVMALAGVKPYYRLGSKIEHGVKKYGTLPPPDFHKWAVICEHIIRHYNEGWANGFHYDIEYWEIWSEPEQDPDDSTNKRTWGGTQAQFYEFFRIALTHLKTAFPHLKIGGPSVTWHKRWWLEELLRDLTVMPDFYSWHRYAYDPEYIMDLVAEVRRDMDELGLENAESILTESNYIRGWEGEDYKYSIRAIKGLKGSSYSAAMMCGCQYAPLDMLMYYDARPSAFNGLFNTDVVSDKLKGYYPFKMFNILYRMGEAVAVSRTKGHDIFLAAAKGKDGSGAIMLTHFSENDDTPEKEVRIQLSGLSGPKKAEVYTLDSEHDMELTESFTVSESLTLTLPLFTTVLIKVL